MTLISGLIVSQALTPYTTPVVYLYFDRLQRWWTGVCRRRPERPLEPEVVT